MTWIKQSDIKKKSPQQVQLLRATKPKLTAKKGVISMSSVSNTSNASQVEARPSRAQCISEAAGVYAMWRAEQVSQEVAA